MERLGRIEETRRYAGAVEGSGEFLRDVRRLPDTAKDNFPAGRGHCLDRSNSIDELRPQAFRGILQRRRFDSDAIACAREDGFRKQSHLEFESRVQSAEFTVNNFSFNPISLT